MTEDVLFHANLRMDPLKDHGAAKFGVQRAGGADGAAGVPLRKQYVQASKVTSAWVNSKVFFRGPLEARWPVEAGRAFWWRVCFIPQGVLTFIDGRFMQFTRYPEGREPADGQELFVQLPTQGESQEKATWRVQQMYWMDAEFDPELVRRLRIQLLTKVRVCDVPESVTSVDILSATAAFNTRGVDTRKYKTASKDMLLECATEADAVRLIERYKIDKLFIPSRGAELRVTAVKSVDFTDIDM
jgi:hypothetical protein